MNKKSPEDILTTLPPEIKEFTAGAVQVYEDKSLGASISYSSEDTTLINVFLYDDDATEIEDGIESDVVGQAREAAAEDMMESENMGLFRNLTLTGDEILEFDFAGEKLFRTFYISARAEVVDAASDIFWPVVSDLYITGLQNYVCKIRVTRRTDSDEKKAMEAVGAILNNLSG